MSYAPKRLWPDNLEFTNVKKGYNPTEVDRAMAAHEKCNHILYEQNETLQKEVNRLKSTLAECKIKMQRLVDNMDRIEEERARESLRMAGLMTGVGKTADQTLEEAKRKSEQIINNARILAEQIQKQAESNARNSREELERLAQIIIETRENLNHYFDAVDAVLRGMVDMTNVARQETSDPAPLAQPELPYAPLERYPENGYPGYSTAVSPGDADQEEDKYEKFLKEMGLSGNPPTSMGTTSPLGNTIVNFGD